MSLAETLAANLAAKRNEMRREYVAIIQRAAADESQPTDAALLGELAQGLSITPETVAADEGVVREALEIRRQIAEMDPKKLEAEYKAACDARLKFIDEDHQLRIEQGQKFQILTGDCGNAEGRLLGVTQAQSRLKEVRTRGGDLIPVE